MSHSLAFSAELPKEDAIFHLILNAYWEPLDFELPPVQSGCRDHGTDGSTLLSTRRATSSHGRPRHPFPATPIGPDRARWLCCTPHRADDHVGPDAPVRAADRSSACVVSAALVQPLRPRRRETRASAHYLRVPDCLEVSGGEKRPAEQPCP